MWRAVSDPTTFRRVYRYNDRDQLVAVEDDEGWRIEYEYDPGGNRTRRRVSAGRPGSASRLDGQPSSGEEPSI